MFPALFFSTAFLVLNAFHASNDLNGLNDLNDFNDFTVFKGFDLSSFAEALAVAVAPTSGAPRFRLFPFIFLFTIPLFILKNRRLDFDFCSLS
jgi:hypothetical protein